MPERDWSLPAKTPSPSLHILSPRHTHKGDTPPLSSHPSSQLPSHLVKILSPRHTHRGETPPLSSDPNNHVTAMLSLTHLRGRELLKEKDAIYRQFSPRDDYSGTSPPEHDYPPYDSAPCKPIQTNVQLTDAPQRLKPRPRSAGICRRTSSDGSRTAEVASSAEKEDREVS